MNHEYDFLLNEIELNKTIDRELTFAGELGKKEANLDGYIDRFSIYFDVKCFKDNVKEILLGIYKQIFEETGLRFHIDASYPRDIGYDRFQADRKLLYNELRESISSKPKHINSNVISDLSFELIWENGVSVTAGVYNPYLHASNYYKTIFNYANKFVKDSPSFIVLVVFPWFNNLIHNFASNNATFYRAISRRVFCQYKNQRSLFSSMFEDFQGNQTIYDVSKKISGLIFIEDNTILSKRPNKINTKPFIYLNPNADNKIQNTIAEQYLNNLRINMDGYEDDFEFDNY